MSRKKNSAAKGCLFWACLVIILAIVALVASGPIENTLRKVFGGNGQSTPEVVVGPLTSSDDGSSSSHASPSGGSPPSGGSVSNGTSAEQTIEPISKPPVTGSDTPAVRKARLYYTSVDANGKILLKGVIRPIPASDSPLRDTLQTLLAGPTSAEVGQGLLTMIPKGSELLNVAVRGDTAYIDFSESFRFNTLGTDGLNSQLKQIVYVATEFPTVKQVQVLIGGKKVQYLASEGIRIDVPLTRQSFKE
jgi:spore germination protein GerM